MGASSRADGWTIPQARLDDSVRDPSPEAESGCGRGISPRRIACWAALALLAAAWAPGAARAGDLTDLVDAVTASTGGSEPTSVSVPVHPVDVGAIVDRAYGTAAASARGAAQSAAADAAGHADASPRAQAVAGDATDIAAAVENEVSRALKDATPAVGARGSTAASGPARSATRQRAGARERARTRSHAEAAYVPAAPAAPTHVVAVREPPSRAATSSRPAARREASGRGRAPGPRAPPGELPVPFAPLTGPSSGAAPGSGVLSPPIVAALEGLLVLAGIQIFARRVAAPRSRSPRPLSLPPWRPG